MQIYRAKNLISRFPFSLLWFNEIPEFIVFLVNFGDSCRLRGG